MYNVHNVHRERIVVHTRILYVFDTLLIRRRVRRDIISRVCEHYITVKKKKISVTFRWNTFKKRFTNRTEQPARDIKPTTACIRGVFEK